MVSANKTKGETEWVSIKSLSGKPCVLKVLDWNNAIQINDGDKIKIEKISENEFSIDLKKGETILLVEKTKFNRIEMNSIKHPKKEINQYGVKKGKSLKEIMEYPVPEYGY